MIEIKNIYIKITNGGSQYRPLVSIKDIAQLIYKKENYDVTFYNKEKTVMEEFQL